MPTFTYTARDQGGNFNSGVLEADTSSTAARLLREQGLWVTDLKPSGGRQQREEPTAVPGARTEKGLGKKLFNPVSLKDLSLFYRQLHSMLHSGMGIYQAMEILSGPTQTPNAALRRVVQELGQHLLVGGRFSVVMERFPWLFDKMQVRMVEAGEQGGLLVEIFQRLAEYLEREHELRQEIKRRTLYPKILLAAVLFIPPIPTLVFAGPWAYFMEIWSIVGMVLLVGVPFFFAMRVLLTTQAGRDAYDQVKLSFPVIGPLVRKMAVARFARTLAALYGSGVPIAHALSLAGEASGNALLERASTRMRPALEHGNTVSQALAASRFFPPMFLGMVGTGETSGNLDASLDKAADFYEDEAKHATIQLLVFMSVLLLLVMAIWIGVKVVGFWGGMYSGMGGGGDGFPTGPTIPGAPPGGATAPGGVPGE